MNSRLIIWTLSRFIAFSLLLSMAAPSWAAFGYKRTITIDHTKVAATLSSFPVLISSDTAFSGSLATLGNGGKVTSSSGFDIGFYTASDCATGKMSWETEDYSATTGVARYWVNVASLSSSVNTVIYLCYGDSTITTDQSNKTAVWDSNFKGVFHLGNGSTLSTADSTSNANDMTNINTIGATSGQIDGGAGTLDGSSQYLNKTSAIVPGSSAVTLSAWIKSTSGADGAVAVIYSTLDANTWIRMCLQSGKIYVDRNTPSYVSANGITAIASSTWYYFTATLDGSILAAFVNGGLENSSAYSGTNSLNGTSIGRLNSTFTTFFGGVMDEVRFSNVARDPTWITTDYNNQYSPQTFYTMGAETSFGSQIMFGDEI